MGQYSVFLQLLLLCVFNKRRIILLVVLIVTASIILWTLIWRPQITNVMTDDRNGKEFNGSPSYIKYFDFEHFVDSNRGSSEKSSICVDAKIEVCFCCMVIFIV